MNRRTFNFLSLLSPLALLRPRFAQAAPTPEPVPLDVFFMRDVSGSMGGERKDIVDKVTRRVQRVLEQKYGKFQPTYLCHDTEAEEVQAERYFHHPMGGGTMIRPLMDVLLKKIQSHTAAETHIFYFNDGDMWGGDDAAFAEAIQQISQIRRKVHVRLCQVHPYYQEDSLGVHLLKTAGRMGAVDFRVVTINPPSTGMACIGVLTHT